MDAISFSRLGNVFTSVMTGNLVLFGLAVGRMDRALAGHVAVAVVTFAFGVVAGSGLAGAPPKGLEGWRSAVTRAVVAELIALVAFAVAWEFVITSPGSGGIPFAAISAAALAMGIQSGAIRAVGDPGLSTTYLTGTLTGALGALATDRRFPLRSAALLTALLVGAAIEGLLVVFLPRAAPLLPVVLVALVVSVATWLRIDQLEARA